MAAIITSTDVRDLSQALEIGDRENQIEPRIAHFVRDATLKVFLCLTIVTPTMRLDG